MKDLYNDMLNTIEHDDIREFINRYIELYIPEYFWIVPASSTGKYHPKYSLGEGGLVRHTIGVVKILNHMLSAECIGNNYTSREKDLLRVACFLHDTIKSGIHLEWEMNSNTKFDHPVLAAQSVRRMKGYVLPDNEIEIIADAIESHMGQWNTSEYSIVTLPKPENKYQQIVHLADYLASRKDITVEM